MTNQISYSYNNLKVYQQNVLLNAPNHNKLVSKFPIINNKDVAYVIDSSDNYLDLMVPNFILNCSKNTKVRIVCGASLAKAGM